MRLTDPFRPARENPLPALILFTLFAIVWALAALGDLRDGVIDVSGGRVVSATTEPARFWFLAVGIAAAEIFALCQIGVAADALLNRPKV